MKVTALELIRYGHFTGGRLELGTDPGVLTVVLADNAAGKTTALNALRDLLFGIPRTSPYRFLHDDDPRIGGEIVTAAGTVLRFERKKGEKRGLLNEEGQPLDTAVLQRVLGPVDRELFEKLFGLDHAQLRSAGEELARGEGRLAEALFVAASGLRGLRELNAGLSAAAEELLTPAGRAGQLWRALRDLEATERDLRGTLRSVSADNFQRLEREMKVARQTLAEKRQRLADEARRKSELERLNRTMPILAAIHETRTEIDALGALRVTDPDLERQWETTQQQLVALHEQRREVLARIATAEAERHDLRVDDRIVAADADISRLQQDIGAARNARVDLPKREGAHREQSAVLEDLCRQLALRCPPESALEHVPPRPARDEVRAAAREVRDLAVRLPEADRRRTETELDLVAQTERLARLGAPVDVAPLRARLDALGKEGLVALLTDVEGRMQSALRRADQHAAGTRHWSGSAAQLAALPLPERALVERYRHALDDSGRAGKDLVRRLVEIGEEQRRIDAALAVLEDGTLPTPERVAAARERRDATWSVIRRQFVRGEPVVGELAAQQVELIGPDDPGTVFETRLRDADRLADERAEQAERLERHREHQRQQQANAEQRTVVQDELAALRAAEERQRSEWRALWAPTGIEPGEPAEMLEWLVRCDEVRKRFEEGSGAALEAQRLRDRLAAETAALAQQLMASGAPAPPLSADVVQSFQAAVAAARAFVDRCAETAAARKELEERVETLRHDAARAAAAHQRLERQRSALDARWARAMQGIGWPPTASADEAEAVCGLYDAIEQQVPALRETRRRIDGMQQITQRFADAASRLVTAVAPDLAGADVLIAAERLGERLDATRAARAARDALDHTLAQARRDLERLEDKLRTAAASQDRLRERLGVTDDEAARSEITRIAELHRLRTHENELLGTLCAAGDGASIEALQQAAEGRSLDGIRADLAALSPALIEATDAVEAAVATLKDLETQRAQRLDAADTGALATRLEEQRRVIGDAATRYAVVKTAETLLRQAIDRFREESAGPQLARASVLFEHITGGAYTRLFTDQDEAGRTLLRTRHRSGRVKGIHTLSDGERDQLYLALRLAAIEDYASKAESLPFVADDLLVHFDNARAARTLETLRTLAEQVQVVFLTHHAHLAELAGDTLGPTGVRLVSLPDPAV